MAHGFLKPNLAIASLALDLVRPNYRLGANRQTGGGLVKLSSTCEANCGNDYGMSLTLGLIAPNEPEHLKLQYLS